MDYFSKFLRTGTQSAPKPVNEHSLEDFHHCWGSIKVCLCRLSVAYRLSSLDTNQNTLLHPDERQLSRGIKSTDVRAKLQSMVDSLVWESSRTDDGYVAAQIT